MLLCIQIWVNDDFQSRRDWESRKLENLIFSKFWEGKFWKFLCRINVQHGLVCIE